MTNSEVFYKEATFSDSAPLNAFRDVKTSLFAEEDFKLPQETRVSSLNF